VSELDDRSITPDDHFIRPGGVKVEGRPQLRSMATQVHHRVPGLAGLLPEDLALLLATEPQALLGKILRLNRAPHYQNRLNAVVLASAVIELQQVRTAAVTQGHRS
jgi:hypothetical protein